MQETDLVSMMNRFAVISNLKMKMSLIQLKYLMVNLIYNRSIVFTHIEVLFCVSKAMAEMTVKE